jgi:hypothetical protein
MTVEAVGVFALGVVIAYLAFFFVVRLKSHTLAGLGALVGILVGGAAAKFLTDNLTTGDASNLAWYPIGLVVGGVVFGLLAFAKGGRGDIPTH